MFVSGHKCRYWSLAFTLIGVTSANAFCADIRLLPGLYATHAQYDDGTANGLSGYATIGLNWRHYLTIGYDDLRIRRDQWEYDQRFAVAGGAISMGGQSLRLSAGTIRGDYSEIGYSYRDRMEILSGELRTTQSENTVGMSMSWIDGYGFLRQQSHQFVLHLESIVHPRLRIIAKPTYTWLLDGRRTSSIALRFNYLLRPRLIMRVESMLGERALYYDSELLTIFNQNETQGKFASAQIEWYPWRSYSVLAKYIDTDFGFYKVRYFVLGLRSTFKI